MATTTQVTRPAGPTSEVLHVTPDKARLWLATHNTHNRPMREFRVAAYARDMTAGAWLFNGETIKFDINKVLIDGQHRLAAVSRAGVPVPFVVIWGLPAEAQDTIDIGATRTMGDALDLRGEPGSKYLAAIARKIVRWERGVTTQGGAGFVTHAEMHAYIEAHPELRRAVSIAQQCRGAGVPAAPSAIASAYHLCAQRDVASAELFYAEQLIKGIGLREGDPARALLTRLQREASGGRQMHSDDVFRFALLAWNHFRAGTQLRKLQAPQGGWTAGNSPIPR